MREAEDQLINGAIGATDGDHVGIRRVRTDEVVLAKPPELIMHNAAGHGRNVIDVGHLHHRRIDIARVELMAEMRLAERV
jgi:hypothetical protein